MNEAAIEVNFDGLVGPTHNYGGLSYGNIASQRHRLTVSHPRAAALQGLAKMKFMADLGVRQAVLPPQDRPDLRVLRRVGFAGSDAQVIESACRHDPALLAACYSASAMWAANAATASPSADSADGRLHLTPANLVSHFHRSLEARETGRILRAIFQDETLFAHHEPLPAGSYFSDEGAANHMRLCGLHGGKGVEVFIYGRAWRDAGPLPTRYPARQAREACEAIARLHRLDPRATFFLQQNPDAIDAGAFHNDVVAVANEDVLFHHERAFASLNPEPRTLNPLGQLTITFERICGRELRRIEVAAEQVTLEDAIASYLFNSQLVTLPDGDMALVCPAECEEIESVRQYLGQLQSMRGPIRQVHFVDVRQSMRNGGGPACLRLRIVLTEGQLAAMHQGVLFTQRLHDQLQELVRRRYREDLSLDDLRDPRFAAECRETVEETREVLGFAAYPS